MDYAQRWFGRKGRAVAKAVTLNQNIAGDALHHCQNGIEIRDAIGQRLVTMLPILGGQQMLRLSRAPEGVVAHRVQPFHHIFNRFKALHGVIVSNRGPATQILGGIS